MKNKIIFYLIVILLKIIKNQLCSLIKSNCFNCNSCHSSFMNNCKCIWKNNICNNKVYSDTSFSNVWEAFKICDDQQTRSIQNKYCGNFQFYDYKNENSKIIELQMKSNEGLYCSSSNLFCYYKYDIENKKLSKATITSYIYGNPYFSQIYVIGYYIITMNDNSVLKQNILDYEYIKTYNNVKKIELFIASFNYFLIQPLVFEVKLEKSQFNFKKILIPMIIFISIAVIILIICYIYTKRKQRLIFINIHRQINQEGSNMNINFQNNENNIINPNNIYYNNIAIYNNFLNNNNQNNYISENLDLSINTILNDSKYLGPRICKKEFQMYNNECSICLESFKVNIDKVSLTTCKHLFHHKCISDYIQKNYNTAKCPNCNSDITHYPKNENK